MVNQLMGDPSLGGFRPLTSQNINELSPRLDYHAIVSLSKKSNLTRAKNPKELAKQLQNAADELRDLESATDIKKWWSKHYHGLGHKRLGRLLLGQSV
jgi:hypothetical protein